MQLPIRSSTTTNNPSTHPQQAQLSLPYRQAPTTTPTFSQPEIPMPGEHIPSHQHTQLQPPPLPQATNAVYIIRLLEAWRQTPTTPVDMNVSILGVFQQVEHANEYTRRWLEKKVSPKVYRYGQNEVVNAGGGIRVDVVIEKMDASLMVDVERHLVKGAVEGKRAVEGMF
ncbi:MAG: hypothetical protein Q9226_002230 [Calogaya cf. arnoldii]